MSPMKKQKVSVKTFREKVYDVVARIPKGSVMTYGEVARRAGSSRAARAVGTAMRENVNPKRVPCHRVVCSDGTIGEYAFGGSEKKRDRLRAEGVSFLKSGKVLLSWKKSE